MDISIIVSIIAIIGTVINAVVNSYANKKLHSASIKKTNAETSNIVYQMQNSFLQDLQKRINELEIELNILKKKDSIHNKEKVRLEGIILKITSENKKLKEEVHENKRMYTIEIEDLNKQVKSLSMELQKYINH